MKTDFEIDDRAFQASLQEAARAIERQAEERTRGKAEATFKDMTEHVAVDTGELLESMSIEETRVAGGTEWELRAGTDHAIEVEFGTSDTEAQPYMRPAIARRQADP